MTFDPEFEEITQSKGVGAEDERLERFLDAQWRWTLNERPEFATWVGEPGYNDRWNDDSIGAIERRRQSLTLQRDALQSIDGKSLNDESRLNHTLITKSVEESLESFQFHPEYLQLTSMGGPHSRTAQTLTLMPASTSSDLDDVLARLEGIPTVLDNSIALMNEGISSGITSPRVVLHGIVDQIETQIVRDPESSPLLERFNQPSPIPQKVRDRSRQDAALIYSSKIRPALESFKDYVAETYLPACRDSIAQSDLPSGSSWYEFNVRKFTTTQMTPKEIHEIGQNEVARIRGEMETTMRSSGFNESLEDFFDFLRTDAQFYFKDGDSLLAAYRDISKRADPELAKLFGTLPRLPYGVIAVPSYIEKTTTTAYYSPGSQASARPGYFYANVYDLASRPKWEMEALTLHEAVPGHHLQIALAQELDLPAFRRHALTTAYVEGWGLYAESLGYEMGFYTDVYSRFGSLTYEMWRAIRLVVDTGMHAMGWGRDKAIEFFLQNAGKAEHDIVVEIDRYISWPGQALAYKIGELKIKELRKEAESKLGDKFDIRAFHDEILRRGALPLDVLETYVSNWIQQPMSQISS